MKKGLWLLVPVLVVAAVAIYAVVGFIFFWDEKNPASADNGSLVSNTICTVNFYSDGRLVDSKTVAGGQCLSSLPSVDEKTGYELEGWYYDQGLTQKYQQSQSIKQDTNLYAKLVKMYTVKFDSRGGTFGGTLTGNVSVKVEDGKQIGSMPSVTRDGFEFRDWYLDAEYREKFVVTTAITRDITLYAKWSKEVGEWCTYALANDGSSYVITGYNGEYHDIILPNEYDDGVNGRLPVKAIQAEIFDNTITSIELPSGITRIEADTFIGCENLVYVKIPDTVEFIGNHAFDTCINLVTIYIPASVTEMGDYVFSHCEKLIRIECGANDKPDGWRVNWRKYCNAKDPWDC